MATSPYSDARNNPSTYSGETEAPTPNIPTKRGSFDQYAEYVKQVETEFELPPGLLKAMMGQESGFNAQAVSPKGAAGLMQLMPATAKELGVTNVFDINQNIKAGAKYIKNQIVAEGGDIEKGLQRYNMGPTAFKEYQAGKRSLPNETKNYTAKILPNVPQESIIEHNAKWGINQSSTPTAQGTPPDSLINNQAGITTPSIPDDESKLNAMVAQNAKAYDNAYAELQKVNTQSNQAANVILDTYGSNPAGVYSALDRSAQAAKQLEESIIRKQAIIRGEYQPSNPNPIMAALENFAVLRSARKTIKTDIADLTALAKARNEINKNINDSQVNSARGNTSLADEINIRSSARATASQTTGIDLKVEGMRASQDRVAQNTEFKERVQSAKEAEARFNQKYRTALQAEKVGNAEIQNKIKEVELERKKLQLEAENLKIAKALAGIDSVDAFNEAALKVHISSGYPASNFTPVNSLADIQKIYPKDVIERIKTTVSGSPAVAPSITEAVSNINNVPGVTEEQLLTSKKVLDRLAASEVTTIGKTTVPMSEKEKMQTIKSREAKVRMEVVQSPTLDTDFNKDIKNALPFNKALELSGTPIREKLKSAGVDPTKIMSDSHLAFESAKLVTSGQFSRTDIVNDLAVFYKTYAQKRGMESGLDKLGINLIPDRYLVVRKGQENQPYDLTKPAAISNYLDGYLQDAKKATEIKSNFMDFGQVSN